MLGSFVTVGVTRPFGFVDTVHNTEYTLNFGMTKKTAPLGQQPMPAYIMGIHHPVREFEGRVIALLHQEGKPLSLVVAPKSRRYIVNDIKNALDFLLPRDVYTLECLYERSCGAVIFHQEHQKLRFLLIKNKRSAHWGFPKGHVEEGETDFETARREILEETGLTVEFLPFFSAKSEYSIQKRVEKTVTIFIARSQSRVLQIQEEEIDDAIWCTYEKAISMLRFDNDRAILKQARRYLNKRGHLVVKSSHPAAKD